MSKEGGGAAKATKSETNSDDKKWKEMLEKTQESENSKKEEPGKGSKEEIQEKSNGLNDKLCLPDDYSAKRVKKERKTDADEKIPLLAPSTVPSVDKGQKAENIDDCWTSEFENYRIPSVIVIIFLGVETFCCLMISTVILLIPQLNLFLEALCIGYAGILTLGILIIELSRFILAYCRKSYKETADIWIFPLWMRIILIIVHVARLLLILGALILIIVRQGPEKNQYLNSVLIGILIIFLVLSALHIFIIVCTKKKLRKAELATKSKKDRSAVM